jgi:hypothetical protein
MLFFATTCTHKNKKDLNKNISLAAKKKKQLNSKNPFLYSKDSCP